MGIQAFASRASRARDVEALAACLLDGSGDLFGTPMRGLYLFEDARVDIHVCGVSDAAVEKYERIGRAFDPVLAGLRSSHAPCQISFDEMFVHSRKRGLPDEYRAFVDGVLAIESRGQYLAAPLVLDGKIAGTLNFARMADRAFGADELARAFAMALHVSTRLAALRALSSGVDEAWADVLTRRSYEVADLAARGLTTHEIGRALGISANTAKKHLRIVYERLGISTRAELASTLMRGAKTA